MKDDLDNLEDIDENIENDNMGENNDENSSDSFLKIDPIKGLDSSNIKIDIPKTEIKKEVETPKKQAYKQTKDNDKEETKTVEDDLQNNNKPKGNSKIIKIGIVALIILLCLGGGYFAYSKFMVRDESENLAGNIVTEEIIEESPQEVPIKEANNITETPIVGYKFKKKEYQKYFGEKYWYNPTTSSQNILTKNEEKLANIIKRYE